MKPSRLIPLILFVSCSPNFRSGKTQCSDKGECPSGFVCSGNGVGAPRVCVNAPTSGTGGTGGSGGGGSTGSSGCGATLVTPACQDLVNSPTADSCTACLMSQCCGPAVDCASDTNCATNSTGPLWNTLTACFTGCCGTGCSTLTGDAGVPDTSPPSSSACSLSDLPSRGSCNVLPACGCPAGQVCHAGVESTGLACTAGNSLGDGADCSSAQVCASGFGCFGSLCSKYCSYDSDCPMVDTAQSCLQTYWSSGNSISDVSVCARVCDPVSPRNPLSPLLACPAGFGCMPGDSWGASDCQKQTGTGITGSYCSDDTDCVPGYFCDTLNYVCVKYCYTVNDCPTGTTCNSFSSSYYAGSNEVGYCY